MLVSLKCTGAISRMLSAFFSHQPEPLSRSRVLTLLMPDTVVSLLLENFTTSQEIFVQLVFGVQALVFGVQALV